MSTLELALIAIIAAQQAFYMLQVHRLLDKAMSNSYYEYKQAATLGKPVEVKVPTNEPPDEDLGRLY